MSVVFIILGLLGTLVCLWMLCARILFWHKYPIVSDTLPMGIVSQGDVLILRDGSEHEYYGIDNGHGDVYYLISNNHGLEPLAMTLSELMNKIDSVRGQLGTKWQRAHGWRLNYASSFDPIGIDTKNFFSLRRCVWPVCGLVISLAVAATAMLYGGQENRIAGVADLDKRQIYVAPYGYELDDVCYICTGGFSDCYHSDDCCRGMRQCEHGERTLTIKEAIDMGRRACGWCYR